MFLGFGDFYKSPNHQEYRKLWRDTKENEREQDRFPWNNFPTPLGFEDALSFGFIDALLHCL